LQAQERGKANPDDWVIVDHKDANLHMCQIIA